MILSFFFLLFSFFLNAQDSIPAAVNIAEKNNIEFQQYFFKALSDKAIFNYQKAIQSLEKCNRILPNNKAVLFELSKNYEKLGRNPEALTYIDLALKEEPNNVWLLEHKVFILRKLANFNDAIIAQQKIAAAYPKKKQLLVFLHLQNKDVTSAKKVLAELKEAKLLNARLRSIERKINIQKTTETQPKKVIESLDAKSLFEKEKSFINLKTLLDKLADDNDSDLLKYSEQGLTLFPAQPFVYLMSGRAFNNNKDYKKALETLQNGIDFVIDNNKIEAKFYLEMSKAYQGLNNVKKANSYKNKAEKILK
ncbi:tetratricopeptide repeat protein [Tenacibaculum sp. SDUM215027]|uniref:tetratricopeptide repeat protein n=1 Tax=Tenacibaculum sp. SDUM215027 TaxID=3422596 RepID=UPI003D31974D